MANTPTHFIKVIRRPFNPSLSIPKSFLPYLNGGGFSKAILRRGGHKWEVDITDGRFSGDGWRKCVKDNGVQQFDSIVFDHLGNMVFDFLVFDPSSCEKQYPNPSAQISFIDLVTESESESEENEEEKEENQLGKKRKKNSSIKKATTSTSNNNPFFTSTLKRCSFTKWILHLPTNFVKSNGLNNIGEVILRDDENRLWKVQIKIEDKRKFYIGCSFRDFVVANKLKEGDAFKFELVENEKNKTPVVNFSCKACMLEDDHERPYFIDTLKSYGLGKSSFLYLPTPFAKKHGLFYDGKIILKNDIDERSWTAKLKNQNNIYCYIGRGWKDFCVANGLKEGDRYKFEIVDNSVEKLAVKFYIL